LLVVVEWIVVLVMAFAAGASFWAVARAPRYLRLMLGDFAQLSRVIRSYGPNKLRDDARGVDPKIGFAKNITIWDQAHIISLRTPRNLLALLIAADLGAGYFISWRCLLVASGVFVLPLLFPIPDSAKHNNVIHVHTMLLNLLKWHQIDPAACDHYCTEERPELAVLYSMVVNMPEE